jgi:hypothetical protein
VQGCQVFYFLSFGFGEKLTGVRTKREFGWSPTGQSPEAMPLFVVANVAMQVCV